MTYALILGIALGLIFAASGALLVTFLGVYVVSALVAWAMIGTALQGVIAFVAMTALVATLISGVKLALQLA